MIMSSDADKPFPLRRLSDKLLSAFDQACDQKALAIAELVMQALELTLTQHGGPEKFDKRNDVQLVAAAASRLKALQQMMEA